MKRRRECDTIVLARGWSDMGAGTLVSGLQQQGKLSRWTEAMAERLAFGHELANANDRA